MKKKKIHISIYELSKILPQQHLLMTTWKEDKSSKFEYKGKKFVNMIKNIEALSRSKSPDSLMETFNKLPPSLNNAIIRKRWKSMTLLFY